jgi:NAD-dependent DNA ligase
MGMKFGDKEYAYVPERLKRFREEHPRAKIDSNPTYNDDGSITFKTTITKDQSDPHSAVGTGNARYTEIELKKPKSFEKLDDFVENFNHNCKHENRLLYIVGNKIDSNSRQVTFEEGNDFAA